MNPKMKQFINTNRMHIINISFYLVIVLTVLSSLLRGLAPDNSSVVTLSENWMDETGAVCTLSDFGSYDERTGTFLPQCVYYTFDSTKINTAVIFRARSCYVNVYVNDELISEDTIVHSPIYGISPGSRWHLVSLSASETPVTLCLEVTACYTNSHGLIDNIYYGSTHDLYEVVTKERIFGFIISAFLWICGVIILILYFYMRSGNKTGKDLLYLALATLVSAQWSSAESLLWQLFFGDSELFHFLGYAALTAIPLSYGMLASCRLKGKARTFSVGFSTVSAVVLIVSMLLHLLGIQELHYTLIFTRILIVFVIPLIIPLVHSYTSSENKKSQRLIILPLLAILVVCIATSLIKYMLGSYSDYSSYVRVALLCFIFCLIVYQFNQILTTFSKGMKADMLHNLALTDHMTGLYNRTAFSEHSREYRHIIDSFSPLGIIQFDVNNLKKVNDTLGMRKATR